MKTIIRTGNIEIDTQKIGEAQWVSATIQKLQVDDAGSILSESGREIKLYRRIDQVATEMRSTVDPVTGKTITASVAALGLLITEFIVKWMLEDNDAYFDSELDAVVLNDSSS